jgi:hypothetical protein
MGETTTTSTGPVVLFEDGDMPAAPGQMVSGGDAANVT